MGSSLSEDVESETQKRDSREEGVESSPSEDSEREQDIEKGQRRGRHGVKSE